MIFVQILSSSWYLAQIRFSLIFNIKAVEKLKVDSPWYLRSSWYLAQVDCIQYLLIIYLTNWKLCANIDGGFAKIFAQILSSSWYLAQIGFSLIFDNKLVDKLKFCANIESGFSVIFAQILSSSWYLISRLLSAEAATAALEPTAQQRTHMWRTTLSVDPGGFVWNF